MKRQCALILGAVVLVATQGCSKEPALYIGGPPGPATQQKVSNSNVTVVYGDSVSIGARAEDAVGNPTGTAVTLTSCDANVAAVTSPSSDQQWSTTAYIKGVGLGNSCVLAQAAGLTADTIQVVVGPVGVIISGPDTILSGATGDYVATFLGAAGDTLTGSAPVTWSTSSRTTMVIGASTGGATGVSPGTVFVQAQVAGGADAKRSAVVVAGVFAGSVSAVSGAPGELITATRAPDGAYWDADTQVRFGSTLAFVDLVRPAVLGRPDLGANELVFAVPARNSTAATTLAFSNIGGAQLAQNTAFTVTQALQDIYGPANLDPLAGPDVDAVKSPGSSIYMTSAGLCAGGVGADCDDFFTIKTGASPRTVTVTLTWNNSAAATGDMDILWCDSACANYVGNFDGAGSAKPEVSKVTIPANTTWRLWINNYAQTATQYSNVKVTLQ